MDALRIPLSYLKLGGTKTSFDGTQPFLNFHFQTKIVWFNLFGFLALHIIGVCGFFLAFYKLFTNLEIATFLWATLLAFLGSGGILIGAHRLWSHKSFKATKPLQIILLALQTMAGQNCLYVWARDHRQHHKYSDTDADPHNATRGFFFSHIGWLMMKKHPEVIKMGRTVDMSDLEANPLVMFQKKYYKSLYLVLAFIVPVATPIYLWNEDPLYSLMLCYFTRYIVLLNATWSVNSFAHLYGYRPYDQGIKPAENVAVGYITMGEGWHNYHHAFPWDYKAAEWNTGYNFTRTLIEYFHSIGWAYDLREASQQVVNAKAKRLGDGSHIPTDYHVVTSVDPINTGEEDNPNDSPNDSSMASSTASPVDLMKFAPEESVGAQRRMTKMVDPDG